MSELVRGLETRHEHAASILARDTRPIGHRVAEFLSHPTATLVIFGTSMVSLLLFPLASDIIFFAILGLFWFCYTRRHVLPFRLPKSAKTLDYNDLIPGTFKPKQSGGIAYFGNARNNRQELWFTNDDMRTHVLIFGSTGSGKTEALISLAFNALIHGSGFIYVDGKGDNSLYAKIFSMVRSMGREDDLLIINFMTGARDVIGPQSNRLSNTMNPFAFGSSSMLSQLVISLMDQASGDPNADMWKGRAINFVESLMKILTAVRDSGQLLLDANSIRDYFILEKLESIVVDKKCPVGDRLVPIEHFPPEVLEPLKNYVLNLPGYNPRKKGDQAGEVREQHGFITMQLTRVFGSLADTYGHILRTNLAEVDVKDVVLNRRILVVLLPALEKSPEELSNLGKIIIASLKTMMAAGLGDSVEGDYRDVILRKPTNSPSPYLCILDEYGYYAVKGFAVVAAQARSLGFSAVFAGQDLPAFQKASKEEAASIGANCNIKICMKLEDPQETWEYFNKTAGETYVTNVSGFQMNNGSFTLNYMDTKNASVDRRQRIELLDLKDQREGESHIFFKSSVIRAEMFYANPPPIEKMRLNHFIKVDTAPEEELQAVMQRLSYFERVKTGGAIKPSQLVPNEDISVIAHALQYQCEDLQPFERGIAAIAAVLEYEVATHEELNLPYQGMQQGQQADELSIFTGIEVPEISRRMIGQANVELFGEPLLHAGRTLEDLRHVERLAGAPDTQANQTAQRMVNELLNLTHFPDLNVVRQIKVDKEQYLADLQVIIRTLNGDPPPPASGGGGEMPPFGGSPFNPMGHEDKFGGFDPNQMGSLNEFFNTKLDQLPELPQDPNAPLSVDPGGPTDPLGSTGPGTGPELDQSFADLEKFFKELEDKNKQ